MLQYGAFQYHKDEHTDNADAGIAINRNTLNQIISGKLKIDQCVTDGTFTLGGKPVKFEEFVGLLDDFDPWYQVAMPIGTK